MKGTLTLPEPLTNWKVVLMLIIGIVCILNGLRIWVNKVAKVADPFLWGPLTGGLGCLVVGFIFHDEEIRGFPARMVALFQMCFGVLCLVMFFFMGVWPAYFAKQPEPPANSPKPSQEMAYLPAQESASPAPVVPPAEPPPVAAAPAPAAAPSPAAAPATAQAPAAPLEPEKPGTIERMSKDWRPEGMQRR